MSDASTSGLLALDAAAHLHSLEEWTTKHAAYPYQRALDGHSGPWANVEGRRTLMLSSYDYLGLIGHPDIEAAAIEAIRAYGTATGGVRLLTGTTVLHRRLDAALAEFCGTDAALTFSAGYLANLAAIATLFGPGDEILVDELAHRSIIDACLLARARVRRFRHNDVQMLERLLVRRGDDRRDDGRPAGHPGQRSVRRLIVVEGVYSMDGDVAPLPALVSLKQRHDAFLLVDEAHALGVLGDTGRGSAEFHGLLPASVDLWTGSLSKAVPSNGGFVAGRSDVIRHLSHAAAPFVFSSAVAPSIAAAALAALDIIRSDRGRLRRLHGNAALLRDGLRSRGFDVGNSTTPIIPVSLGNDTAALAAARFMADQDIHATPVIHPAVAHGQARLRLCASAGHEQRDLEQALAAFERLAATLPAVGNDAA